MVYMEATCGHFYQPCRIGHFCDMLPAGLALESVSLNDGDFHFGGNVSAEIPVIYGRVLRIRMFLLAVSDPLVIFPFWKATINFFSRGRCVELDFPNADQLNKTFSKVFDRYNGKFPGIKSGNHNLRVCVKPPVIISISDEAFVQILRKKGAACKPTAFVNAVFEDSIRHGLSPLSPGCNRSPQS